MLRGKLLLKGEEVAGSGKRCIVVVVVVVVG